MQEDPQALNRLGWQKIQAKGEERDIDQGIAMIRAAAEAGYAKAIYNLALIEQEGQWVEKDLDAAFDGMMRASRMGLIEAKAALGFMYERGLGVGDPDEALYWYEEAATYGRLLLAAGALHRCYRIDRNSTPWGSGRTIHAGTHE